jgi:hypothetical protein
LALTDNKKLFEKFIKQLLAQINTQLSQEFKLPKDDKESADLIANILHEINRFFYTQTTDIRDIKCETPYGVTDYFSEFHKFWEGNHRQTLGVSIDNEKCQIVAERLELNYRPFSPKSVMDIRGLTPQQVADVRLLTAIQDFGFGLGEDYYNLARQKPQLFNPRDISRHPEYVTEVLKHLRVADYQPDKRIEWVKRCVALLIEKYDGTAFNLGPMHNYDATKIREVLVNANIGIDVKKADMFLRDMQEFGIWKLEKFEEVSVAADMNTMRIALRTGIIHTRIPLLSSFMDVFCYQYGVISEETNRGWRRVWELWRKIPNNHSVSSPAFIDFLIYNMGRKCCRARKRRCDTRCSPREQKRCLLNRLALTNCDGWCIFKGVCDENKKRLNPPKSISIFGRYGWTTSYSDEGGGLGLRCS